MSPAALAAMTPTDGPGWQVIILVFLVAVVLAGALDALRGYLARRRRGRDMAHRQ